MKHRENVLHVQADPADEVTTAPGPPGDLWLVFESDPLAVRRALQDVLSGLSRLSLSPEDCGTIELVLAEVLNNIVEHAYDGAGEGLIELRIVAVTGALNCVVTDVGKPMPDRKLPLARRHDLSCRRENLPEGGFGWALIRDLTQNLHYDRINGKNCLSFRLGVALNIQPTR